MYITSSTTICKVCASDNLYREAADSISNFTVNTDVNWPSFNDFNLSSNVQLGSVKATTSLFTDKCCVLYPSLLCTRNCYVGGKLARLNSK